MQSVRTDTAAWLSDKQYAWSQYPQDDACIWETFVQQVGHTGPVGFWVNHIVFAAVACYWTGVSQNSKAAECVGVLVIINGLTSTGV